MLAKGSTGAVVELAQKRDFSGEVRRFVATGSELVVPEDLPSGMWFWRLRAHAASNASPTEGVLDPARGPWEMLVRGKALSAESDVPHGGIVDSNGDGEPDLLVTAITKYEVQENGTTTMMEGPTLITLFGRPGTGTYDLSADRGALWDDVGSVDLALAAGTDLDGDGFGDLLLADVYTPPAPDPKYGPKYGQKYGVMSVFHGAANGLDNEKDDAQGFVNGPRFLEIPSVGIGDVNGDGYGDVLFGLPDLGAAMLGSATGAITMMVFSSPAVATTFVPPLAAGFDADRDGLGDVALASDGAASPLRVTRGSRARFEATSGLTFGGDLEPPTRAIALVAGDFDGDGNADLAFSTTIDGKPSVCVHAPDRGSLVPRSCWTSDAPALGFGTTLAAGDLDADGKDEILVASTSGIVMLTHLGNGFADEGTSFVATAIPGSHAPRLTVIHPGRPGKAKWAVYASDGRAISIFQGLDVTQKIDLTLEPSFVRLGTAIR